MDSVMEAVNNLNIGGDSHNKNRIQVSNTKKPLFFYVNLAKRYMQQHNEVELSALGMVMGMVFEGVIGLVEIGVVSKSSIQNPLQVDVKGIKLQNFVMQPNTSIATAVTIAEILKNNGLAVEKKIMTSTVDMKDQSTGRPIQKAKIEILLRKAENFDELMAAAT